MPGDGHLYQLTPGLLSDMSEACKTGGTGEEQEPAAPLGRLELPPYPRAAVSVPLKAARGRLP